MKVSGLNITITRGETANLSLTLTNEKGQPFVLLAEDMFSHLNFRFRVKRDPYSIVTPVYVINKLFDINDFPRFDNANILNLREYVLANGGTYNANYWSGNSVPGAFPNQLFYHPALDEYAYFDEEWKDYYIDIVVPFTPKDTIDLDYGDYYYDGVIEASNETEIEYVLVAIPQHLFTIDYRT